MRQVPTLAFPQAGIDDPASYQGYQTRFYRDAARNTVQLYMEGRTGRVVHLLANADNESIAFTARGASGGVPELAWASPEVQTASRQGLATLSYRLVARAPHVHLGWFLLGSMRVERDFQYWGRHRQPFASPPFSLEEMDRLLAALEKLPPAERTRHLATLRATSVATIRNRLSPRLTVSAAPGAWTARVRQLSLDGRDSLVLQFAVNPRMVSASRAGDSLSLQARSGDSVTFTVTVGSSAKALTPLAREEIFTPAFLRWLAARRDSSPILERQARGVELLSSREKLMAGLPA
ncbi:MAG TPA: hypothetical protein VFO55_01310, partial [Gemmatimonadaceae bacterium]|nr:hypothetical protein [Gemmatimonadaceae bacterium]